MAGRLIVIPTPLGNLGDITLRALDALRTADVVCAEDTRVTGKLLAAFDIKGKRIERLDENTLPARAASIIARVQAGETIAYCSDAGMPGVSDPGLRLVRAAREANAPVEVLPGPTAAATAYVASGTVCPNFFFGGFLPRKQQECKRLLETLKCLDALETALVFYESPRRLVRSLSVIAEVMPKRTVIVCRELTKLHEEVVRGTAAELAAAFNERESIKGEIALVIDAPGAQERTMALEDANARAEQRAVELLEQGEGAKTVAKTLIEEFGISRNAAYDIVYTERKRS